MALLRLIRPFMVNTRHMSTVKPVVTPNHVSEKEPLQNKNISVKLLTKEDIPAFRRFIHNIYLKNEITLLSTELGAEEFEPIMDDLVNNIFKGDRVCSYVAWDKDKIVGMNLSSVMNKEEYDAWVPTVTLDESFTMRARQYMDFYRLALGGALDLLPGGFKGNVRCTVEGCIDPEYRRSHLTQIMLLEGDERARTVFNCGYSMSLVTSGLMFSYLERMGWKRMRRFHFEHYFVNGKRFFQKAMDKGVTYVDLMIGPSDEITTNAKRNLATIDFKAM